MSLRKQKVVWSRYKWLCLDLISLVAFRGSTRKIVVQVGCNHICSQISATDIEVIGGLEKIFGGQNVTTRISQHRDIELPMRPGGNAAV